MKKLALTPRERVNTIALSKTLPVFVAVALSCQSYKRYK